MARVTVEDCLQVVDNRFALVLLSAARTRQLMKGSRALVEGFRNNEQVISLREIAAGKVQFDRPVREVLECSVLELDRQYEASLGIKPS